MGVSILPTLRFHRVGKDTQKTLVITVATAWDLLSTRRTS